MLRVNIDRGYYVLVGLSRGLRSHLHFFFVNRSAHARLLIRLELKISAQTTRSVVSTELSGTGHGSSRDSAESRGLGKAVGRVFKTLRREIELDSPERDTCCICNTFFTCCSFVFHFLVRKEQRSPGFAPHLGRRSSPVRSSPTRFNSHRRQ